MSTASVNCATDGCDGKMVVAGRNRRDADYRASKLMARAWTCYACDNRKAIARAEAAGLPTLEGSEKQVAWAATIRENSLAMVDHDVGQAADLAARWRRSPDLAYSAFTMIEHQVAALAKVLLPQPGREKIDRAVEALRAETDARFWIDSREESVATMLVHIMSRLDAEDRALSPEGKAAAIAEQEAMAEATMRPPSPVSETVAEISFPGGRLVARYDERSDEFNATVKRLGFRWDVDDRAWVRGHHAPTMGSPVDRLAETAHELLAAGIVVAVHDPEARAKAIARSYEPEHRRWIALVTTGAHKGKFRLTWGRDEDFYGKFRGLRGAAYKDKACLVPATSRDDVLDFAATYGFRLTAGAQARAEEVLAQRERGTVVNAVAGPAPEPVDELREGPPAALPIPEAVEVDSDLVDHD